MKNSALIIVIGILLLIQPVEAQTWEAAKRLTWNPGASRAPSVATDSSNGIHIVWQNNYPGGRYEIYYQKSKDGGTTWATKRLTYNSRPSTSPAIAISSNDHIHMVWVDGWRPNQEIHYKKSTDGGATWTSKRLTWSSGSSLYPAIAVDSNNHVHVVWEDNTAGMWEIYHKMSSDGGATWKHNRLTYSGSSKSPAIALDQNSHIHVAWEHDTPTKIQIYYATSKKGGENWKLEPLTLNYKNSLYPSIISDSNKCIHVFWCEEIFGHAEIYYLKSKNLGKKWSEPKRITTNSGDSLNPAVAVDSNNNLHLVWHGGIPWGNDEIYYMNSNDSGMTWTTERLTYNYSWSAAPAIAVDSSNHLHIVWEDSNPDNLEIYYKKGIQ